MKAAAFVYTGAAVFSFGTLQMQGFCFDKVVVRRLADLEKMS